MRKLATFLGLALGVNLMGMSGPADAGSIGLDFGAGQGSGGPVNPMAADEVAGIVPQANWNSYVAVEQTTPVALLDDAGAASGVTATWTGATNDWSLPIDTSDGDFHMMKGYIENIVDGSIVVSLRQIPYALYDVYIYADGEGFFTRMGQYSYATSSGMTGSALWTDPSETEFDGTYIEGQNYVKFTSLSGADLDLTATVLTLRAPINGIQIVAAAPVSVPEPGSVLLLAIGGGGAVWIRRGPGGGSRTPRRSV